MATVAADDESPLHLSVPENLVIRRRHGDCLFEEDHVMPPMAQKVPRFPGDIMVQKEFHEGGPAICSAISASIFVR